MRGIQGFAAALFVFMFACTSNGDVEPMTTPAVGWEESVDLLVCEEAIRAWFDLLVRNPDSYETNEETQAAFAEWRDTFC